MGRQTTHNTSTYSRTESRRAQYSASSGYYMSGSSAVAPEYLYQEEVVQEQHRKAAVKPKKKHDVAQWLATLTVVFAMGMALEDIPVAGGTAAIEPRLDYIVAKFPRFPLKRHQRYKCRMTL